jgi:hypothetical protein
MSLPAEGIERAGPGAAGIQPAVGLFIGRLLLRGRQLPTHEKGRPAAALLGSQVPRSNPGAERRRSIELGGDALRHHASPATR